MIGYNGKVIIGVIIFQILMILAFTTMFIGIVTVNAAGPESDGYIKIVKGTGESATTTYLYGAGQTIGAVDHITYDSSTNTLTLNNYDLTSTETAITISKMGDLNINVVGTNNIYSQTNIFNISNTNSNIYGTGTLNIYGAGIKITTENTLLIKDIKINGININDGRGYLLASENGDVTLNNIASTFGYNDGYVATGFYAKNLTIKKSNIKGFGLSPILTENDTNIEDSDIEVFGLIDYKAFAIMARNELNIKNSTITSKNPFGESWAINILNNALNAVALTQTEISNLKAEISPLAIGGVSIVIDNSNIITNDAVRGVIAADLTLNSGTITSNAFIGIAATQSFTMNGGKFVSKDSVVGIKVTDGYEQQSGKLILNDGTIDITTMDASNPKYAVYQDEVGNNSRDIAYSDIITAIYMMMYTEPGRMVLGEDLNIVGEGVELKEKVVGDEDNSRYIYYFGSGEIDMDADDPFADVVYTKNLLIRNKNWKPDAINNETITNVPDTLNNKIVFIIVGTLVVAVQA